MHEPLRLPPSSAGRLEALSDGVFAIVMTLLIFDIRVPRVAPAEMPMALVHMWPSFAGYFVSFALLGVYWSGHRAQFNFIVRADQNLTWINIIFLSLTAFVPFSTGLLTQYPHSLLAVSLYGINLTLIGVVLYWHLHYGIHHAHLLSGSIAPHVVRYATLRCLLAPACYLIAIGAGLIDTRLSLVIFAATPFLYIIPWLQGVWWRWSS